MNDKAALGVLAQLTAAFPGAPVATPFAHAWADALSTVNEVDAATAADLWVRTHDRLPTIAQFLVECRQAGRRRAALEHRLALEQTTGGDVDEDPDLYRARQQARLGELRAQLASSRPQPTESALSRLARARREASGQ